jgi:hypothetical protein
LKIILMAVSGIQEGLQFVHVGLLVDGSISAIASPHEKMHMEELGWSYRCKPMDEVHQVGDECHGGCLEDEVGSRGTLPYYDGIHMKVFMLSL